LRKVESGELELEKLLLNRGDAKQYGDTKAGGGDRLHQGMVPIRHDVVDIEVGAGETVGARHRTPAVCAAGIAVSLQLDDCGYDPGHGDHRRHHPTEVGIKTGVGAIDAGVKGANLTADVTQVVAQV
jgi:hypothetical protein